MNMLWILCMNSDYDYINFCCLFSCDVDWIDIHFIFKYIIENNIGTAVFFFHLLWYSQTSINPLSPNVHI